MTQTRPLYQLIREGAARAPQVKRSLKRKLRKLGPNGETYGTCALGAAMDAAGYYDSGKRRVEMPKSWYNAIGFGTGRSIRGYVISQWIMLNNDGGRLSREQIADELERAYPDLEVEVLTSPEPTNREKTRKR